MEVGLRGAGGLPGPGSAGPARAAPAVALRRGTPRPRGEAFLEASEGPVVRVWPVSFIFCDHGDRKKSR